MTNPDQSTRLDANELLVTEMAKQDVLEGYGDGRVEIDSRGRISCTGTIGQIAVSQPGSEVSDGYGEQPASDVCDQIVSSQGVKNE